MFDLLGAGLGTIIGTLSGIATSALLHWLFPWVTDALYIDAGLVAIGFIVGIGFDIRRENGGSGERRDPVDY